MFGKFKRVFYFPVAAYFRFFARIRLSRWHPRIIVVTGSNGKTTLLHMLEAQLGENARYSHHANSSFGIPFDILGLERKTLLKSEWFGLLLQAPLAAFKSPHKEKIYIVEADCDRPGEGKFLAVFLKPEVVLWVSTAKTHSINFDSLVSEGKFKTVEEAIAYEYGYFLEYCQKLAVIDGDSHLQQQQIRRTKTEIVAITKKDTLEKYAVGTEGTTFQLNDISYSFKFLLPEEAYLSIAMCKYTTAHLNFSFDTTFKDFHLPPGRSSVFEGIKETTLIDSSYNLSPGSVQAILAMYSKMDIKRKWVVIGDMLELGESEKEEHEKLAEILGKYTFDTIILVGPRVKKYTYPKLRSLIEENSIEVFERPKEVLEYLLENIKGKETILFKSARFMEGIIEQLLKDKKDIKKLPRREKIWEIRRKQWGL